MVSRGGSVDFPSILIDHHVRRRRLHGKHAEALNAALLGIEYRMVLVMALLWRRHFDALPEKKKMAWVKKLRQAYHGDRLALSRELDQMNNGEFGTLLDLFSQFVGYRNDHIGHGYILRDTDPAIERGFQIYQSIKQEFVRIIGDYELIVVDHINSIGEASGLRFKGREDTDWPGFEGLILEVGDVLLSRGYGNFEKISPFIYIDPDSPQSFYVVKDIDFRTQTLSYNGFQSDNLEKSWKLAFKFHLAESQFRQTTQNQTVINPFTTIYSDYIELAGNQDKIMSFLCDNAANVLLVVWGHGGVGKTALVQNVVRRLAYNEVERRFNYIVFMSAKNQEYDPKTATVKEIPQQVTDFESAIRLINQVIFEDESHDPTLILGKKSSALLIFDDFETFDDDDKRRILEFCDSLNASLHKVIITTRSSPIYGKPLPIEELDQSDSVIFFKALLKQIDPVKYRLIASGVRPDHYDRIHQLTSGRPIFLYQLAYMCIYYGSLDEVFEKEVPIHKSRQAVNFLFGRILRILDENGRLLFKVIGRMYRIYGLSLDVDKIRYVSDMEKEQFQSSLDYLLQYRLVEEISQARISIYSREIADFMASEYDRSIDELIRLEPRAKSIETSKSSSLFTLVRTALRSERDKYTIEENIHKYASFIESDDFNIEERFSLLKECSTYLEENYAGFTQHRSFINRYAESMDAFPEYKLFQSEFHVKNNDHAFAIENLIRYFGSSRQEPDDISDQSLNALMALTTFVVNNASRQKDKLKRRFDSNEINATDFDTENELLNKIFTDEFHLSWRVFKRVSRTLTASPRLRLRYVKPFAEAALRAGLRASLVLQTKAMYDLIMRVHPELATDDMERSYLYATQRINQKGMNNDDSEKRSAVPDKKNIPAVHGIRSDVSGRSEWRRVSDAQRDDSLGRLAAQVDLFIPADISLDEIMRLERIENLQVPRIPALQKQALRELMVGNKIDISADTVSRIYALLRSIGLMEPYYSEIRLLQYFGDEERIALQLLSSIVENLGDEDLVLDPLHLRAFFGEGLDTTLITQFIQKAKGSSSLHVQAPVQNLTSVETELRMLGIRFPTTFTLSEFLEATNRLGSFQTISWEAWTQGAFKHLKAQGLEPTERDVNVSRNMLQILKIVSIAEGFYTRVDSTESLEIQFLRQLVRLLARFVPGRLDEVVDFYGDPSKVSLIHELALSVPSEELELLRRERDALEARRKGGRAMAPTGTAEGVAPALRQALDVRALLEMLAQLSPGGFYSNVQLRQRLERTRNRGELTPITEDVFQATVDLLKEARVITQEGRTFKIHESFHGIDRYQTALTQATGVSLDKLFTLSVIEAYQCCRQRGSKPKVTVAAAASQTSGRQVQGQAASRSAAPPKTPSVVTPSQPMQVADFATALKRCGARPLERVTPKVFLGALGEIFRDASHPLELGEFQTQCHAALAVHVVDPPVQDIIRLSLLCRTVKILHKNEKNEFSLLVSVEQLEQTFLNHLLQQLARRTNVSSSEFAFWYGDPEVAPTVSNLVSVHRATS